MSNDVASNGLRQKYGLWAVYGGFLLFALCAVFALEAVEGSRRLGGVNEYLAGVRWQDHPRVVAFGFGIPLFFVLLWMGSLLRTSKVSIKWAVGVPAAAFLYLVVVGLFLWFPRVSMLFGVGGILNGAGIGLTLYLCVRSIRPERPLPGFIRGLGYLSFAFTAWFNCGLLCLPGGAVYANYAHDYAVITDLASKIQICWVTSWLLTSLGFYLERQEAAEPSRSGVRVPDPIPARLTRPLIATAEISRAGGE